MNTLDLNKDGKIDYSEFLVAFGADEDAVGDIAVCWSVIASLFCPFKIREMEALALRIDVVKTPIWKEPDVKTDSRRAGAEKSPRGQLNGRGKSPRSLETLHVTPKQVCIMLQVAYLICHKRNCFTVNTVVLPHPQICPSSNFPVRKDWCMYHFVLVCAIVKVPPPSFPALYPNKCWPILQFFSVVISSSIKCLKMWI